MFVEEGRPNLSAMSRMSAAGGLVANWDFRGGSPDKKKPGRKAKASGLFSMRGATSTKGKSGPARAPRPPSKVPRKSATTASAPKLRDPAPAPGPAEASPVRV